MQGDKVTIFITELGDREVNVVMDFEPTQKQDSESPVVIVAAAFVDTLDGMGQIHETTVS